MLSLTSAGALAALVPALRADAQVAPPPALRVGSGLIEAQAEAHYALDTGLFKKQNLTIEIVTSNNGAASAAAVAGGDLQIAATSLIGLAQAYNRGLPFQILAAGAIYDSRFPSSGLLVAPSSPVTDPKELNGKTIGVGTLKGLDQLLVSYLIDSRGGDSSSLKFVELKPVTMLDALLSGRIDAAQMDNPEYSRAKGQARLIGDGEAAVGKTYVETVWFATRDWLAANADTGRRFRDAIYDAGDWAMANPDAAGALLQQDLKLSTARAATRFSSKRNATLASYKSLLDVAAKYNFINAVNASDLVWKA
jgi:NitT/TauT family transport system substrate-binding protein